MADTDQRFFTTFQVGRICGVFPTTVIKWVADGRLKASITPGGHRRIPREHLLAFLKEHGYAVPPELRSTRKTILIVDDDPAVCRMIQRAFKDYAAQVRTESLSSGIDALVEMGKNPPDLVILDVVMPVVDGASLCASLKANPATQNVKIMAITGKRIPEKKLSYIRENTHAFFEKPFEAAKLREAAMRLLMLPLEDSRPPLPARG